jgi:hypothetical protein
MRRALKIIGLTSLVLTVTAVATPFLMYRVPRSAPVTIEGEVLYKFIDLAPPNNQGLFEYLIGNYWVRLVDGTVLYVTREDGERIWEDNPHDMRQKGYTKYVVFEASPLLFGGFSVASIKEIRTINKPPTIRK